MILLLDTNILVRISQTSHPLHHHCLDLMRRVVDGSMADDLYLCTQNLIEYWSVATRPLAANGLGLSSVEANCDLRMFLDVFGLVPEPVDIAERWLALVLQHNVLGRQAHDARLVALMLSSAITHLLTLDPGDFTRYSEITCLSPLDM